MGGSSLLFQNRAEAKFDHLTVLASSQAYLKYFSSWMKLRQASGKPMTWPGVDALLENKQTQ